MLFRTLVGARRTHPLRASRDLPSCTSGRRTLRDPLDDAARRSRDPALYLAELMRHLARMDDAACRDSPTELFFPTRGDSTAPAKAYCSACEVRDDCLAFALEVDSDDDMGVWGGTSAWSDGSSVGSSQEPARVEVCVVRGVWATSQAPGPPHRLLSVPRAPRPSGIEGAGPERARGGRRCRVTPPAPADRRARSAVGNCTGEGRSWSSPLPPRKRLKSPFSSAMARPEPPN